MGCVEACLDEILALGLGDEGLELCSGEGIDETGLGDDKEEDLGPSEGREFVGLETGMSRTVGGNDDEIYLFHDS